MGFGTHHPSHISSTNKKNQQQTYLKIAKLEESIEHKKQQMDKIGSEIIPNLLAEQGISSLKLADGSSVDVSKSYNCTIKKDEMESAYNWLRENGLGDIIKNEVSVQFGKGEDNKAEQLLNLAVQEGYEPSQKQKVEPMKLTLVEGSDWFIQER